MKRFLRACKLNICQEGITRSGSSCGAQAWTRWFLTASRSCESAHFCQQMTSFPRTSPLETAASTAPECRKSTRNCHKHESFVFPQWQFPAALQRCFCSGL